MNTLATKHNTMFIDAIITETIIRAVCVAIIIRSGRRNEAFADRL